MTCGVDKATGKGRRQQVSECIALLQHPGDDTASSRGAVFECRGSSIAVETTHGNTEKGAHGKEMFVCLGETGAEFQGDKEEVVDYKGPFQDQPS